MGDLDLQSEEYAADGLEGNIQQYLSTEGRKNVLVLTDVTTQNQTVKKQLAIHDSDSNYSYHSFEEKVILKRAMFRTKEKFILGNKRLML